MIPSAVRSIVTLPVRMTVLPGFLRAGYALLVKYLFSAVKLPAVARIERAGDMKLEPWDLIDSRLYFFDVWEPALSAFMVRTIRQGDIVADIGANIGYFTLLMSKAVGPGGHVYAVEPCAEIRDRLNDALQRNAIANVTVIPYGISDKAERRSFTRMTANLGASRFGEASDTGLELRRLGDVIPAHHLGQLSFIKIDVEGMESHVMRDLATILPTLAPRLTICAELRMNDDMREILKPFWQAGMEALHLPNRYTMFDYPNHPTEPEPFDQSKDGQFDVALTRG